MKTVIDVNPRKVLVISNKIARFANKEKFTEEDLVEKNDVFFINININKTTVNKLPPSLQRFVFETVDRENIITKLGEVGLTIGDKRHLIREKNIKY